jgi:SAM-dependent methyltransferase
VDALAPTAINETKAYYTESERPSLFWEMTISQCLASRESPYQRALEQPARYGEVLARFLVEHVGLDPSWAVMEVGGGYGSLMAALLDVVPVRDVAMVDISPFFTEQQRLALHGHAGCRFATADALDYLDAQHRDLDLVQREHRRFPNRDRHRQGGV